MVQLGAKAGALIALSVRSVALFYGLTFLIVGIGGFISGCVDGYDSLAFAGPSSTALLFGVFQVSVLHNIVHLLYALAGLAASATAVAASRYLLIGGVVYLLLWSYGMITMSALGPESAANFLPMNAADNWLHFALAVSMAGLGAMTAAPARLAARAAPFEHG